MQLGVRPTGSIRRSEAHVAWTRGLEPEILRRHIVVQIISRGAAGELLGTTPLDTGTKLVYVLSTMRAALEAMALERIERRLADLEPREGSIGYQGPDQPAQRPH